MWKRLSEWFAEVFDAMLEEPPDDGDTTYLRPTEDEYRHMGISGEYYHYKKIDDMDQFWRRFGPRIRADLPRIRARKEQTGM